MYHKIFLVLCGVLLGSAIQAQSKAIVSGKMTGIRDTTLSLNYQEYALLSELEKREIEVDENGVFYLELEISGPARAFLVLGSAPADEKFTLTKGDGRDTSLSTQTNRTQLLYLYLTPKAKQYVELTAGAIPETLRITGKNSADSYYLNEEDWRFNQYRDKHLRNYFAYVHYNPDQYLKYVEERETARSSFLKQFAAANKMAKHLKHVAEWAIYTDAVTAKLLYPSMRSSYRKDNFQADSSYYRFMDTVRLDKTKEDKGIAYFYFLDYFLKESYKLSGSQEDYFDFVAERITGRPLYEYYAFALRSNFKRKLYDKFGASSPYPDIAKIVRQKYRNLEGMLEGNPAPLVALSDTSGNSYTFADWKGKYIYIDFWATWCGPCIQEIPSLKVLEHDYADKNIIFLSISMDKEKDHQKWIDFVREKELTGNQVWLDAANNKRISQAFHILQIPRFVLLDDEGRILDANAPRPSDKKVRILLDKLL